MEGRNPDFAGVQSYLSFIVILKNLHVTFFIKIKFQVNGTDEKIILSINNALCCIVLYVD